MSFTDCKLKVNIDLQNDATLKIDANNEKQLQNLATVLALSVGRKGIWKKTKKDGVQKETHITSFCISGDNIPWCLRFYLHI